MNLHYPFTLKPLPYDSKALCPYISDDTLSFHHGKHLKTYIDNLNNIISNYPELMNMSLEELIINQALLPDEIKTSIKNNAGGVYNHMLYFNELNSSKCELPTNALAQAINIELGGYEKFKDLLSSVSLNQFGSGYGWLILSHGHLEILSTDNQDTPINKDVYPLLCIDVWEHAYYLDYQNRRKDYIENFFNLINWEFVENRYLAYIKKQ